MDKIVEFVRKFLKAEFECRVFALTDTDRDKRGKKFKAALAFCAEGVRGFIDFPVTLKDSHRDKAKRSVERPLFVVREFQNGKLYEAIVGEPLTPKYGSGFEWAALI